MREDVYRTLTDRLCIPGSPPQWKNAFDTIPDLTLDQRKNLANLARAQCDPTPGTALYRQLSTNISAYILNHFISFIDDPFSAGLLMSMLRLAPLPPNSIHSVYQKSVLKERNVMDRSGLPPTINYNAFFGSPDEPIIVGLPPNPNMAKYVQAAIDNWISREKRVIHYPTLSRKTISDDSRDEVLSLYQKIGESPRDELVSQVDLEYLLHHTGVKIGGPCEMRQKWYPANFVPRTYYAAGGEAFHVSKNMASLWTRLADSLPPTNRISRVLPTRLQIKDQHHAFIYDLSSFTSNLHEHKYFLQRLGLYCAGNTIKIVDARGGIVDADLGEMIMQYNALNDQAKYSLRRVHKGTPDMSHHTAGFLGVYGNIATATFLHGSVMLQLCDHESQLNVAGDDGIKDEFDDNRSFSVLRHLGELEWTKCFVTHEDGCIHLKRPLKQVGNRLYQGRLINWPSFEYVLASPDQVDPRYPFIRDMKRSEWRDALASSITGFLTSLTTITMQEWMIDVCDSVLHWMYQTMDLPLQGNIPQISGSTLGFVPQFMRHCIGLEPKRNTIMRLYRGQAKVSYRDICPLEKEYLELHDTFSCNSNKRLGYLHSLGYLERTRPSVFVWGEGGLSMLLKEYFEPTPVVFDWIVVREVPEWIQLTESG